MLKGPITVDICIAAEWYPHIFLSSPLKHKLWPLIRSTSVKPSNEYPYHIFHGKKKKSKKIILLVEKQGLYRSYVYEYSDNSLNFQ